MYENKRMPGTRLRGLFRIERRNAVRSLGRRVSAALVATWTVLLALAANTASAVDLDRKVEFAIAAQPLSSALVDFSRQARIQVMSSEATLGDSRAVALNGQYSIREALSALLKGTALAYKTTGENTVAIVAAGTSAASSGDGQAGISPARSPDAISGEAADASRQPRRGGAASDDYSPSGQLEEIIVTAQKREERLIDVPISVVAMGEAELQRRGINSMDDLSLAVPGLAIQSSGGFQRRIMLRGVSNTVGASSLVGIYIDEASVTSSSPVTQLDVRAYDIERVEVLRGPQGTLYGEGSAGGTIRFITKKPQLSAFEMNADVTGMVTEGGEPGGRAEGALNLPLIDGELALRIAGVFDRHGGWMDQPAVNQEDFNDQELANVRIKGLWQPTDRFTVDAMAIVHRNDAAPNVGENANGDYVQVFNLTTTPNVQDDYEVYNATLSYDFSGVRLLGTTTRIDQEKIIRNQGFRFQLTPQGTPTSDSHFLSDTRTGEVTTQELRLISTGAGPWRWTIGGFYQDSTADRDLFQYFGVTGAPGTPLPAPLRSRTKLTAESWAAFGDASYALTERFTVGAGLRYFETDQQFRSGATLSAVQKGAFDSVNPRLYAQYRLTDRANVYASAAKGFRSGGFNNLAIRPPYEPESVWTYELGLKAASSAGDLSADVAIFFTDYSDYQIFGFLPQNPAAGNLTSNAGNAEVRGIEASLAWQPADGWLLALNGNYIDAEFVEINATTSSYAVGDTLDLFPEYGYTASVQRDFELLGRESFARLDYNEQGRMTYRNRQTGPWLFNESDIINMLNLRVSTQWTPALSVSLFAQNLLDDRGFTDPFGIDENAARARPRTYGVTLGMRF